MVREGRVGYIGTTAYQMVEAKDTGQKVAVFRWCIFFVTTSGCRFWARGGNGAGRAAVCDNENAQAVISTLRAEIERLTVLPESVATYGELSCDDCNARTAQLIARAEAAESALASQSVMINSLTQEVVSLRGELDIAHLADRLMGLEESVKILSGKTLSHGFEQLHTKIQQIKLALVRG